jgi:hypothetical protein
LRTTARRKLARLLRKRRVNTVSTRARHWT